MQTPFLTRRTNRHVPRGVGDRGFGQFGRGRCRTSRRDLEVQEGKCYERIIEQTKDLRLGEEVPTAPRLSNSKSLSSISRPATIRLLAGGDISLVRMIQP